MSVRSERGVRKVRAALPAGADEEHFSSFFTFDRYRGSGCVAVTFQITPGKIGLMPLAVCSIISR